MKLINIKLLRNTIFLIVFASTSLMYYSCTEFLDITPKGSLSEPVLANKQGVRGLLNGAYGALDGAVIGGNPYRSSPDNWVYGSVAGGDAHKGSTAYDQSQILTMAVGNATPTLAYLNDNWRARYEGISRANSVIKILTDITDMSENEKTQAEAEARFIRGHFYFELRRMFGWVPWIDEQATEFKIPNDREIWPDIEADFTFAMNNLPEVQAEIGRVNNWAAKSYLAKVFIYQKKWQEAKALYDDIIANGVTSAGIKYDLNSSYRYNWEPAYESTNPEAVFQIQQVVNDGTGDVMNGNAGQRLNFPYNSPFLCCGFYQPTQELVNSFRTDDSGLPLPDSYNVLMVNNDMNINSTQQFAPYTGNLDPRLDWTAGRRGVPYLDWGPMPGRTWIRDQPSAGPYVGKKNVYWKARASDDSFLTWSPGTSINVNVIRFADVLLMAAEAEVEVGSLETAMNYVNRVRNRASDPSTWVNNENNRAYANGVAGSEAEMLNMTGIPVLGWVLREDSQTTFVFLGGDQSNINSWQEYEIPNYAISEYSSFPDKTFAREAVHFERKLELAMEGHRFFDLVRWEEADEKLNAFFAYEKTIVSSLGPGKFTPGKNELYPIPQNQIDLSTLNGTPTLIQNQGYQ